MPAANEAFLSPTYAEALKGLWAREYEIPVGAVLYRFINTGSAALSTAADGPWWFEYEHFQTMKHFAGRHGFSLGYSARLFAAILYEWSEVNAYVRAEVRVPLAGWKGKGKQIIVGKDRPLYQPEIDSRDLNHTASGIITEKEPMNLSKMTPMQGPNEVHQLYVPGLGRPHLQFSNYFKLLDDYPIVTG